ncbi:uncharacterized protein LOC118076236 [Zootoca vivipara]|uniref:uncharacterized protein LOC118076236 n=1 Tax=Zootoca vivipara TaxID=8524 RepID=UPI001590A156|nr:uncharacterized protein LOC118076236 [Zootoca vivipara]
MDRSSRKAKKPTTGTTEQASTEKLTEDEKAIRKEMDNVLQGELAKLLAEEAEKESPAFQDEVQKGKATEKSKESPALQNEVEKAQTTSKEDTERESPQSEVGKASAKRMSKAAESEPSLSWGEAGKGRVGEMSKQGMEEENTQEETEEDTETQGSRDSESLQAEAEESSEMVSGKQGSLSSKEQEEEKKKGLTQRIMRDLPTFQKLKASEVPEKYKKRTMDPRLAKLLHSEPSSSQKKKLKHQLSLKESRVAQILSQDLSEDEEEKEESKEADIYSLSSKSSEAFETSPEEKMKAAAAAEDGTPKGESLHSTAGSSVWSMGQKITHWKMAHQHGYHVSQLTQDKIYKQKLLKHERDTKISMPMPLQEVMEEEVFDILVETLFDYHNKLGPNHPLTIQMEHQVEQLHLQLQGRRVL